MAPLCMTILRAATEPLMVREIATQRNPHRWQSSQAKGAQWVLILADFGRLICVKLYCPGGGKPLKRHFPAVEVWYFNGLWNAK